MPLLDLPRNPCLYFRRYVVEKITNHLIDEVVGIPKTITRNVLIETTVWRASLRGEMGGI